MAAFSLSYCPVSFFFFPIPVFLNTLKNPWDFSPGGGNAQGKGRACLTASAVVRSEYPFIPESEGKSRNRRRAIVGPRVPLLRARGMT